MIHRPSLLGATRWVVDGALMLLVVIALATLVVARLLPTLGHPTVVITGRSMEPTISLYAVVVLEPVAGEAIRVGDVVTVTVPDSHLTFTHRVEEIVADLSGPLLVTHGDANASADPTHIPSAWVVGRAIATVPALGYPMRLVSAASGILFVLSLTVWLFVVGRLLDDLAWDRRVARRQLVARVLAEAEHPLRTQPR